MKTFNKHTICTIILLCSFILNSSMVQAEHNYLFTWNEGKGTEMPGWTWSDDVAYGHPGWTLETYGPFGGGKNYYWGYGPRCFEMGGDASSSLPLIDQQNRAPSTSSGGSLKIYDYDTLEHHPGWWVWYDGETLADKGITDDYTDRWSFYIKLQGTQPATSSSPAAAYHVGTYLCSSTGLPTYGTSDGCPFEGPGNQHYYHYLYMSPGAWIHVELDRHPTHLRESFVAGNDPAYINPPLDSQGNSHPMHYMAHLHQWYMEICYNQAAPTAFWLDEMYFYSTQDPVESAEANQNDESITSLWIGYWPDTGKWQTGWQDMSFSNATGLHLNDNTQSTFEIRWSTAPITNANYTSANIVTPEWFTGPAVTSYPNGIRRQTSWRTWVWTQFELPENIVNNNDIIYFAIKDVSNAAGNAGTNWPYNRPDGHNAPSPYIRTINYHLGPANNHIVTDQDKNISESAAQQDVTEDIYVTENTCPSSLISNTSPAYPIVNAAVNETIYTDRSYIITSLPDDLTCLDMIKTANSHKYYNTSSFLNFDLKRKATIYIAYPSNVESYPSWLLNEYTQTSMNIDTSNYGLPYSIWEKTVPAGTVTIPGNSYGSPSGIETMYFVLVR